MTTLTADGFTADVMPATLQRSALGRLRRGDPVNLERALTLASRLGGHLVSGHIDGVGVIRELRRDGNATWITIQCPPPILRLIVEKGSIAIDGVSLTVAAVAPGAADSFAVSIIPHTGSVTTLTGKKAGDPVNLENDIIGKYVQRLWETAGERPAAAGTNITADFLLQHGF